MIYISINCLSLQDTSNIAEILSEAIAPQDIFCFYGDLGAGKTTFIRFLIESLHVKNNLPLVPVTSPTFSIITEYQVRNLLIAHFDLYRIDNSEALEMIGGDEYFNKAICLIEWPQRAEDLLPERYLKISLIFKDNMRQIILQSIGGYSMPKNIQERLEKLSRNSHV